MKQYDVDLKNMEDRYASSIDCGGVCGVPMEELSVLTQKDIDKLERSQQMWLARIQNHIVAPHQAMIMLGIEDKTKFHGDDTFRMGI
jgi:hypothetical protein